MQTWLNSYVFILISQLIIHVVLRVLIEFQKASLSTFNKEGEADILTTVLQFLVEDICYMETHDIQIDSVHITIHDSIL